MTDQTITQKDVLSVLSKVQEPELKKDLVSLNMIRDIKISDGNVSFSIVLTTPACPLKNQIEKEAREAVEALPGVKKVEIKFESNVPSDGRNRGLLVYPFAMRLPLLLGKVV